MEIRVIPDTPAEIGTVANRPSHLGGRGWKSFEGKK
jgi:hypothetical protein